PAAYGASGPDTTGTQTFLPIAASCRIAQTRSEQPRRGSNDYVERVIGEPLSHEGNLDPPAESST
ncbi:MAG: hypothetical protein LC808_36885, partial [Actinobacteria bacterium]|nr:hypothetical protein [Actinomycetota bacterium]